MGKDEPKKIRDKIATSKKFHPGKISKQYIKCNKKNCACQDLLNPKKHGPYYQLSYSIKGKSTTRFIKEQDVLIVQEYINEYHRVKNLLSDLSEAYINEFKVCGWDVND
ncbi:MAG: DUF6788 family protein [Candidatus Margulisiibacteriota bacterium]